MSARAALTPAARRRRVLTTVLTVLGLLAAGLLAVGALGYCSVFGCTLGSEDFEPHGARAEAARTAATAEARSLTDRLVAGRPVLAEASADGCTSGQNDWKRKDTYSHECAVLQGRLVAVTPATGSDAAVAAGLTAADTALREAGCRPVTTRSGLARVRDEYWTADNPQVRRHGAAGLPGASYTCTGGTDVLVQPTSAEEPSPDPDVALGGATFDTTLGRRWFTVQDLRTLRESGARLALVLTVREGYYRTRF